MSFRIVADSSCDLNKDLKELLDVQLVPLKIQVDEKHYIDDKNLEVKELLQDMKNASQSPKTACPSPSDFVNVYEGEENIFVVTLSSALSGTYNSAVLAKNIVLERAEKKFVHVFDSLSASIGETLISLKIFEIAKKNYDNLHIVETVNNYIKEMKTFFVLESLDNLIKAGRMNKVKGKIASILSIKPVLKANDDGTIGLVESVRGSKKALKRLVEVIGEQGENLEEKILGIAHCNCIDRALEVKSEVLKRYNFKDIIIVETAGLSSVYADDGGIIIAF